MYSNNLCFIYNLEKYLFTVCTPDFEYETATPK